MRQARRKLKRLKLKLNSQSIAMKYHVTMQSGRDFILNSGSDVYEVAWQAYEECCLFDDYLVDVEPIYD